MPKYSVLFFGSNPDEDNDDCWIGFDFDNLPDAYLFFENPWNLKSAESCRTETHTIVLDAHDLHLERINEDYKPTPFVDDDWQKEIARQAGMMGGCDAYNDSMGW